MTGAVAPSNPVTVTRSGRTSATWSWPSSTAFRVNAMNAATSLARKFSPSPRPTTSGELRRAPTTASGSLVSTATSVNAPSSRWQTARMAVASAPPRGAPLPFAPGPEDISSSSRCATSSVSVWEVSSWPPVSSSARSAAKFSMMPLCTTARRPAQSVCGCAFGSVGGPWVAQRVWPRPTVPGIGGPCSSADFRLPSLPARLTQASSLSARMATPAES